MAKKVIKNFFYAKIKNLLGICNFVPKCDHNFFTCINNIKVGDVNNSEITCINCAITGKLKLIVISSFKTSSKKFTCNKYTYQTKKEAETVLNTCKKKKRKKQPTRIYCCDKCSYWHLTSH